MTISEFRSIDNNIKPERRTGPVDIARWQDTPPDLCPGWVLISYILDRPVSPEEAAVLYEDNEFWAAIEARVASVDAE